MMDQQAEQAEEEVMELGVRTARGGMAFVSGLVGRALVLIVLFVLLARLLGPTDFGFYTIIIAFYSIFEATGYFGLGTTLRKKLPEATSESRILELIDNAYFASACVAVAIMIVVILLSNYIATSLYNNPALTKPLIIVSVAPLLSALYNVANSSLLGLRKNKGATISTIAFALGYLVSALVLVLLNFGVSGAVFGLLIGNAAGFLVGFVYLDKFIAFKIIRPTKKVIRELIDFSVPIFVSNLSSTVAISFGVLFLGIYTSTTLSPYLYGVVLGNYGAAYKIGSFVDVILLGGAAVVLPAYSHAAFSKKLSREMEAIYNGSIYYILILLLPLVVYAISISIPLMAALFGYIYSTAPYYFAIVAFGQTISTVGRFAGNLIISYGDVKRFMRYQLSVAVAEVILLVALIPYLSVYGLLIALFVIGPVLLDVIYILALRQQFSFRTKLVRLSRILLASIILGIMLIGVSIILHQSRILILVNALLTIFLYPPLLVVFGAIDSDNIRFLEKVNHKVRVLEMAANPILKYTEMLIQR